MKFLFSLMVILFLNRADAQLASLFSNNHKFVKGVGDIFKQFDFKIVLKKDYYIVKHLSNDSTLFDPNHSCFYETFDNKYLVITLKDSSVVPNWTSEAYYMFPRKIVIIIPIDSLKDLKYIYSINLGGEILMEDSQSKLPKSYKFDKIKKIDIKSNTITIYDRSNKRKTLSLKKESYPAQ